MRENKKVLIVDDESSIRRLYQKTVFPLESEFNSDEIGRATHEPAPENSNADSENYRLSFAENGMTGIEFVKRAVSDNTPFALTFIHMKMPGLNGIQTLKQIWEIDPKIRVVVVTGFAEYTPDDIFAATGRTDVFYLKKPFNLQEILQFARVLTREWNLEKKRDLLEAQLAKANTELDELNRDLGKKVHQQASMIVQLGKMASIGRLAAGVAHEINNPVGFVSSNLEALSGYLKDIDKILGHQKVLMTMLQKSSGKESFPDNLKNQIQTIIEIEKEVEVDYLREDISDLLKDCTGGVEQIGKTVGDLKNFAHPGRDKKVLVNINKGLESTLNVVYNELKYKAEVKKEFGDIPMVRGYPQKLNQVFMNILVNAAQAIEKSGEIKITTDRQEENITVNISDNGSGIEKKNLEKIFDPFFTTKEVGKGTGLGMNIAYNIIKQHQGTISVESKVGEGTNFKITLPSA